MKKIIPVVLVLVLVLAFMIVPSFAAAVPVVYEANFDGDNPAFQDIPPVGTYTLSLRLGDFVYPDCVITLVSDDTAGRCVAYLPDIPGNSYYSDLRLYITEWAEVLVYATPVSDGLEAVPLLIESCTLTPVSPAPDQPPAPTGDPADVFAIFSAIGDWLFDQIPVILVLFWNAETSQLTVLGGLAILFVGIGLTALLVALVRRLFKFG